MTIARSLDLAQLYATDYLQWLEHTVSQLQQGDLTQVDWAHLVDDLEDMGRSERRSFKSNLIVVLRHLLKWHYQPEPRTRSWQVSLLEHRRQLREALTESPSLKPWLESVLAECYQDAIAQAAVETGLPETSFPAPCPYNALQILDATFLPD